MPATRTMGFGTGEGQEGVVVTPELLKELENPWAAIAEYLREIRDRYVLNAGLQPLPFSLAANVAQKFDFSQTIYNSILLTITSGTVLLFFGDYTSQTGVPGNIPHITLSAALADQSAQYSLPPGPYVITLQADAGGTAAGCITPMAL